MGAKVVRVRLKNGEVKEYRYDRRSGERLDAIARQPTLDPKTCSVGNLICSFRRSKAYIELKPSSRRIYEYILDIWADFDDVLVVDVRKKHINSMRDVLMETPGKASLFVAVSKGVFEHGVDQEVIEYNPCHKVERPKLGEYKSWPESVVKMATEKFSERCRRAIILALYTGQRIGDILAMRWTSIFDEGGRTWINVVQQKTGKELTIPCHPDLLAELHVWRLDSTGPTIITGNNGSPLNYSTFLNSFIADKANCKIADYVFHGLRKNAAIRLAECGCSTHEISYITGQSLQMVEYYTRGVRQRRNAIAAMDKMEGWGNVISLERKRNEAKADLTNDDKETAKMPSKSLH